MNTHDRIEALQTKEPEVAATLEAVKWIGNACSHTQTLSIQDVLEGAALLERALRQIYDTSDEELARLAKQINKRRGRQPSAR